MINRQDTKNRNAVRYRSFSVSIDDTEPGFHCEGKVADDDLETVLQIHNKHPDSYRDRILSLMHGNSSETNRARDK